jgi:hypothetical protein
MTPRFCSQATPATFSQGRYRTIQGNTATALGLIAASQRSGLPLVYGSYPITPASDILHELAKHKNFGVITMQMEADLLIHERFADSSASADLLARMSQMQQMPTPIGIFHQQNRPCYEQKLGQQIDEARRRMGAGNLETLLHAGETWTVQPRLTDSPHRQTPPNSRDVPPDALPVVP